MNVLDMIESALILQSQESHARAQQRTRARKVAPLLPGSRKILSHFGLEQYAHRFLASPDGLAILANCCNCAAKWYDESLYAYKSMLINAATSSGIECWQQDGIVYIETSVGQVSFHALYGEDEGLPPANGREWNGLEMQFNARLVATAWLHGWSRYALKQIIQVKSATTTQVVA